MELEKLFLTKEEIPILHNRCFQIPIHPKLLDSNIRIDESIAQRIFPEVAREWRNDLKAYLTSEKDLETRKWYEEVFLKKEKITIEYGTQSFGGWEDNIQTLDNGFACGFSISRNSGGGLYFNKKEMNCKTAIPGYYLKFSREKTKEFEFENFGEYSRAYIYAPHNIDYFPSALFLRNWALKYMNEVFKEIFR